MMTTKHETNIFLNIKDSNKSNAASLFFNFAQSNENDSSMNNKSSVLSKRENFSNEIRKKKREQIINTKRQQNMKFFNSVVLFNQLQEMANKNKNGQQNISELLSDLKKFANDLDFCQRLEESQSIKQYLLDLYISDKQLKSVEQKIQLIQSLIYLTYYGHRSLGDTQRQKFVDTMIVELQKINHWNFDSMNYLKSMLDLLTNIAAEKDQNFNLYLVDTKIFYLIAEKITQISDQAQKISHQSKDQGIEDHYIDSITDIRESFIGTLFNLSPYQNQYFFQFTVNELVNDKNYIETFPVNVVRIFTNFFQHKKFRQNFFENYDLLSWFQDQISFICQRKFQNSQQQKTGKFMNSNLSQNEKQLFYQYLCCLMEFVDNERYGAWDVETNGLVEQNLNLYCLSEYLIQSAGSDDQANKKRRNSVYVSKAIEMYEYLASDSDKSINQILVVTSERTFQDIIKVFLDQTYFTSCRISDVTLSFLNKIISKENQMLKTFMQLRILQSIDYFLDGDLNIQTKQQIINFLELLTFMVISEDEISRKDKKPNQIVRLLEMKGFIKRIQRYQDHQEREVSDKVQAFICHIDTYRDGNSRQEAVVEI